MSADRSPGGPSLGTTGRWEAKKVQRGQGQYGRDVTAAETGATPVLSVRAHRTAGARTTTVSLLARASSLPPALAPQRRVCAAKTLLNLLPRAGPTDLPHRNTRELVGNSGSGTPPRPTEPDP